MSRMLWRRPSTFFCMSTMGTSVTMPSARIEQIADALLAVLARLRPQGREDELVAAGKLLRFGALLGGVLQDGVDREHQLARLLVGLLAFARILRHGAGGRLRSRARGHGRRRCAPAVPAGGARGAVSATLVVGDFEISSAMPSRCAVCANAERRCAKRARQAPARAVRPTSIGSHLRPPNSARTKPQNSGYSMVRASAVRRWRRRARRGPANAGRSGARPSARPCGKAPRPCQGRRRARPFSPTSSKGCAAERQVQAQLLGADAEARRTRPGRRWR